MDRGMQYRPEYRLDRLRMMFDDRSSNDQREGEPLLHLRWLRTMVVDLSHTAECDVGERLSLQRRSAVGCAVERVVCRELSKDHFPQLLLLVTQCVPLLTSLDLRGCTSRDVDDDFLLAVAGAHGLSLRRLYLPFGSCVSQLFSSVAQSTLDRFTQLEELDASRCENLTNVDFCSATLCVLYANNCRNLTDTGLLKATRLEVLDVGHCWRVTNVSPFAHCLLELDAASGILHPCGIGSVALFQCRRLQILNADDNDNISTLQPFAHRLRELSALDNCALNDAALANATGLVSLSSRLNQFITTVAPFGASLRRLDAIASGTGDAGLVTATNLVYLDASFNGNIFSFVPFSSSLLELQAVSVSICQNALSAATSLIWLHVSGNEGISTVQSCGRSLRHLAAWGSDCAPTDEGISTATQLVTFDCSGNSNLTTIEPFLHSLEELTTGLEEQCLEVWRAPNLHSIKVKGSRSVIAQLERNGFIARRLGANTPIFMHRNTVTYGVCMPL